MFFGEYEHTIDDKSRLTLPARFRDAFEEGVVITKGLDANLDVYSRAGWERTIQAQLGELDPFARETRDLKRFFFAGAVETVQDKQGRVLIPLSLVRHAGLGREAVVAGVHDHLEVWDRVVWAERRRAVEGSADDVAERLAAKRG